MPPDRGDLLLMNELEIWEMAGLFATGVAVLWLLIRALLREKKSSKWW
jgi:type VI protein secretion system component VasF